MLGKAAALLLASAFVYQPVSAVVPSDTVTGITLTDMQGQSIKAEDGKFMLSYSEPGTYHYIMKGKGRKYRITSRVYTDGSSLESPVLTISENGKKVEQATFVSSERKGNTATAGETGTKDKSTKKKSNPSASIHIRVPKTGDESQLTVYASVMAESLLVAYAAKKRLKKAKEDDKK